MARVSRSYPPNFHCNQCGAILLDLHDSFQADQQEVKVRLRETAQATDRSLEKMRDVWLSSIGKLPDDEFQTLRLAHYPRSAEARRRRLGHEGTTGHSVYLHGWQTLLGLR
jgi:hypothetical protein